MLQMWAGVRDVRVKSARTETQPRITVQISTQELQKPKVKKSEQKFTSLQKG